mmetsp:Transcript_17615/g.41834  ORF Transcript_17615/g.41834 Transcript_17615/m.41834 type:complete len:119 (-) Transcript_17615:20-376(-)
MRAGEEPILQHEPPAQIHASPFGHRELENLREGLDFLSVTPKCAKLAPTKEADGEQSECQRREPDPDCSTLALAPPPRGSWGYDLRVLLDAEETGLAFIGVCGLRHLQTFPKTENPKV